MSLTRDRLILCDVWQNTFTIILWMFSSIHMCFGYVYTSIPIVIHESHLVCWQTKYPYDQYTVYFTGIIVFYIVLSFCSQWYVSTLSIVSGTYRGSFHKLLSHMTSIMYRFQQSLLRFKNWYDSYIRPVSNVERHYNVSSSLVIFFLPMHFLFCSSAALYTSYVTILPFDIKNLRRYAMWHHFVSWVPNVSTLSNPT